MNVLQKPFDINRTHLENRLSVKRDDVFALAFTVKPERVLFCAIELRVILGIGEFDGNCRFSDSFSRVNLLAD